MTMSSSFDYESKLEFGGICIRTKLNLCFLVVGVWVLIGENIGKL